MFLWAHQFLLGCGRSPRAFQREGQLSRRRASCTLIQSAPRSCSRIRAPRDEILGNLAHVAALDQQQRLEVGEIVIGLPALMVESPSGGLGRKRNDMGWDIARGAYDWSPGAMSFSLWMLCLPDQPALIGPRASRPWPPLASARSAAPDAVLERAIGRAAQRPTPARLRPPCC
jgi:hypothetical protein